jgi:hypothetical protein
MSRRRPGRAARRAGPSGARRETVEVADDGEWVVRPVTGAAARAPYRCPGCDHAIPPATPHVVCWPVPGTTLSGGGLEERRHWHSACWRARARRRPGGR